MLRMITPAFVLAVPMVTKFVGHCWRPTINRPTARAIVCSDRAALGLDAQALWMMR